MAQNTEVDPTIYANSTYRPDWADFISGIAAQRAQTAALMASARDTLALNQALQTKLDLWLDEIELLNRIRANLKSANLSPSAPDLVVNELIERVHTLEDAARGMAAKTRTDDLPAREALKLADYHNNLILDALGVPTRDSEGMLCTDGRIYKLAEMAGLDLSEFPPHLMRFHRQVNHGDNTVHNVITALEALVARRTPPTTEPKVAPRKFGIPANKAA